MAKVEKLVTKVNTELIGSFKYAHDTVVGLSGVKGAKSDEDRERLVNNACKKIAIKAHFFAVNFLYISLKSISLFIPL